MIYFKRALLALGSAVTILFLWLGWSWYSIVTEEVEFRSGDLVLRGTLLSPRTGDSAPAVVLVHGSGATSRKSMMLYAWLFAYKGYAALAYDKRGVGSSDGGEDEWRRFSFEDLAADATAAFNFLQSRDRVDPDRIGFFGASQGGWVVALAATQVQSLAFLIMVSASVSTVAEDRIYGREAQVRYAGFDDTAVEEATRLIRADHEATMTGSGFDRYLALWATYSENSWFETVYGSDLPEPPLSEQRQWEATVLDYDPLPLLRALDVPVLWIFGDPDLDRFSPVRLSMERVKSNKAAGACYQIIQIDGAGHTLELEDGGEVESLLTIRLPLILDIYHWLDTLNAPENNCGG